MSDYFASQQNTNAVATLKYFITNVNFFYYVFIKKLCGKVLEVFLTPIPSDKNESALIEFITSDLLNTKFFFLHLRI